MTPTAEFCVASASWLEARVPARRLGLLALQHVERDATIAAQVRGRALGASIHFVRSDGAILTGARAVLAAGRLVARWCLLVSLLDQPLGHALLEPLYREVASHRRRIGRLLGLPAECPLPARSREPA